MNAAEAAGAGTAAAAAAPVKQSKKPKYSKFTQQELPACKPLLTPKWVIATFFIVGVVFIPIGAVALAASRSVVEVVQRYDEVCLPGRSNDQRDVDIRNQTLDKNCQITVTVTEKMEAPVYVYYELDNFYQNHRRYVKSRSDTQLRGDSTDSLSACTPEDYLNGNSSLPINPCGLIAWSYFNDSYSFGVVAPATGEAAPLPVNEKGIAWKSDRNDKFGHYVPQNFNPPNSANRGGGNITGFVNEDEHFIVWMRTAALPTFRKLWGKIETDLEANTTLRVNVVNRYNTYPFDGKKKLVLSTASWLGGKNDFLGVAYLTVGSLSMALGVLFMLVHLKNPRPLGDTSYLSWNKKSMAAAAAQ